MLVPLAAEDEEASFSETACLLIRIRGAWTDLGVALDERFCALVVFPQRGLVPLAACAK